MARLTKIEQAAAEYLARARWSDVAVTGRATGSLLRLHQALEEKAPGAVGRARDRFEKERDANRFEGNPPAWAKRMVRKYERGRNTINLKWRRAKWKSYSSGRCRWDGRIVLTANSKADEDEQRAVLAHELAHHRSIGFEHDEDFYDELYAIATAERILRHVLKRDTASAVKRAARRARAARSRRATAVA